MEAFGYPPECVESARHELTRYYYAAISAHGTYILSVVVGIFTLVQAFHYVTIRDEVWREVIASVSIGMFSALLVYFVGRIFVYTKRLYWMRFIRPWSYDRIMEEFEENSWHRKYGTVTPMLALELAADDALNKKFKCLMECFEGKYQRWVFFGSLFALAAVVFAFEHFGVVNF